MFTKIKYEHTNRHIPSGSVIQPQYFHYKRGKNTKNWASLYTKTEFFLKQQKNLKKKKGKSTKTKTTSGNWKHYRLDTGRQNHQSLD